MRGLMHVAIVRTVASIITHFMQPYNYRNIHEIIIIIMCIT